MSKFYRSSSSIDEYFYDDETVVCECGLRASRRVSRTSSNPNRRFFGCPLYKTKVPCLYFDW
ncbi:hypothetical protein LINPERPRIM_LOCUS18822 [Linum perenne]